MEPSQANVPVSQTNRKYRSKTTAGRARRDPVPFENEEEDIGSSQAQVDNDEQEVAPRRKRRGDDDVEKDAADDGDASKRRSAETILPHHKSRQGGSDGRRHRIRSRQRQSCAVQRYGKHLVLKESMQKKKNLCFISISSFASSGYPRYLENVLCSVCTRSRRSCDVLLCVYAIPSFL